MSIINNNNNPRLNTLNGSCFAARSLDFNSSVSINPDYATMFDVNVDFSIERTARPA